MRLNQLRDFVVIVQAGSIRAAARTQGVTHPAMTKSLRQLEEDVGVRLIERSPRGVVPTPAGRALLERARTIQAEVRRAEEELQAFSGVGSGTIAISVSPAAAALLAPDAIAEFVRRQPEARMRVIEGTPTAMAAQLRDGTLDFALGNRPAADHAGGLKFRVLLRTPMVIAARRDHPLQKAKSIRDLVNARWIGLYPLGDKGIVERAFATESMPFPHRYFVCESHTFGFALLQRSDALMPVPAQILRTQAKSLGLTEIALETPFPDMVLGMCTRADARLTPLAAMLSDAVIAAAGRLARAPP